jgi:hypothetical protein
MKKSTAPPSKVVAICICAYLLAAMREFTQTWLLTCLEPIPVGCLTAMICDRKWPWFGLLG